MGRDNDKKSWLQKLKHLMTVTESQAMEEEQAKLGQDNQDEKPIMEEIFSNTAKDVKKEATYPIEKQAEAEEKPQPVHKPALKLVTKEDIEKEFVKQAINDFDDTKGTEQLDEKVAECSAVADNSVDHKAENSKTASDTVQQAVEDRYDTVKPEKKQENAEDKPLSAQITDKAVKPGEAVAEKEEPIMNKGLDKDRGDKATPKKTDTEPSRTADKEKRPEEEPVLHEDKGIDKTKPYKKTTMTSIIQGLVAFGQILNEKPDEYQPDEEPVKDQKLTADKIKQAVALEEKQTAGKKLTKIVEENNLITKQDQLDKEEKLKQAGLLPAKDIPKEEVPDNKFVKVERPKGNIIIEGDRLPMYTFENQSPKMNVEIGKLTPVLMKEYEYYLEPEQLKALQEEKQKQEKKKKNPIEVITEATTTFGDSPAVTESIDDEPTLSPAGADEKKAGDSQGTRSNDGVKENKTATNTMSRADKKAEKKANKDVIEKEKAEKAKEPRERKTLKEALFGDFHEEADYSAFTTPEDETVETIDDYESPRDAKAVRAEINLNIRKLFFRSLIVGIIFVLALAITVVQRTIPNSLAAVIPNVDIMFCIVNFLFLVVAVAVCSVTIKNGFAPLLGFRGNSDTAVSVAAVAAILQCIVSFFNSREFFMGGQNLYGLIVLFALVLNSIGKMWIVLRIKDNFKYVTADKRQYAAKIFNDEKAAQKMVNDTNAYEPIIAFQRRTKFLKNFLRLSYAPDPSEKVAAKFAPVCAACAVTVAIIHGIIYQSVSGAISSFALVACVGIPVCSLLAVNIPMRLLCKEVLKSDAMIVGYPAVKQFSDTAAVMVDSRELYPRTNVELISVKPFISYNLEQAVLNAAAVMKAANTSMTYVFEDIIRGRNAQLPEVDSVKYEDAKGLVGWVGGERILIGTRELLIKYGVEPPSYDFEEPYVSSDKQITYLSNAGQLIAMFVTTYSPNKRIMQEMKRLDSNGVSILVRTADSNISQQGIATDFQVHSRSVKILPSSLGNICKDEISIKEEESRSYVATRGKLSSLARAISGCIKIKRNISMAIAVQFIAVVLGIIIAAAVAILAGVESFGVLELLMYSLFWAVASVIAPLIQRP